MGLVGEAIFNLFGATYIRAKVAKVSNDQSSLLRICALQYVLIDAGLGSVDGPYRPYMPSSVAAILGH